MICLRLRPISSLLSLFFLFISLSSHHVNPHFFSPFSSSSLFANALPLQSAGSHQSRVAQIVLLHMYDSVSFFRRLGHLTGENKQRYARRHGYEIVYSTPEHTRGILTSVTCPSGFNNNNHNNPSLAIRGPDANGQCWEDDPSFDIDHSRAPTFGKIKLALSTCRGRDDAWVLWTDADAMVVNQSIPLETIIDDAYDLIYSVDWLMMNAGMLLVKCSTWAKSFLQQVYDARKFDSARALDQSALQSFIDALSVSERRAHIKIVPKYAMDVYTEEYRPGDFLIHFAGKLYEATEPGLFAIANQYDILSMVDDIEDIEAFFRGRRFLNYYSATCNSTMGDKKLDCKPEDPRRILLKESLGSMSFPNRYRHVGLRYYWLGNWKDAYDVSGWDVFKQPLQIPPPAPPQQNLERDARMFHNNNNQFSSSSRRQTVQDENGIKFGKNQVETDGDTAVEGGEDDSNEEAKLPGEKEHKDDDTGGGEDGDGDKDGDGDGDAADPDDGKIQTKILPDNGNNEGEKASAKQKAADEGMADGGAVIDDDDAHQVPWKSWILLVSCIAGLFGIYRMLKQRRKMSSKKQ